MLHLPMPGIMPQLYLTWQMPLVSNTAGLTARSCLQVPVRSLLPKSALDDSSKQLSLRDLTAAMQKHHNYCKSTMLYKLMLKEEHKPPSKT